MTREKIHKIYDNRQCYCGIDREILNSNCPLVNYEAGNADNLGQSHPNYKPYDQGQYGNNEISFVHSFLS